MSQHVRINEKDKVIVVGVGLKSEPISEIKENLCELEELVMAAGGDVIGSTVQVLPQFNPSTLIGTGKVQEIKEMVEESKCNLVVLDHQLSGIQTRNLQESIGCKILDRSQLILDIFAQRARTYEGKLQVELAQLLDQMPRMIGAWNESLSRLGGGIGTRGPGESALENDRRRIREKISLVKKKLDEVSQHRAQHRQSRKRNEIPSFALIGYTNSGKSSLLNRLTGAQVVAKNMVFATLDPTTRKVFLDDGPPAVVTDTVGFIRKLPPQLIEAFKATLEESSEADILLHVVDLSSPNMERQIEVIESLMKEFKWEDKKIIHVFNKVDIAPVDRQFRVKHFPRVFVSALTGQGFDQLKKLMSDSINEMQTEVELYFDRANEYRIYDLSREAKINRKEPATEGTICFAMMTPTLLNKWRDFLVK
ncbi:MAG: GTPase HflX [Bdellovibrionales bacterium RIFCSPHIGHO2_01_FULL_40_29]|nr:MAG: GTPase HflX [Bdellovibrionales bacterium RIFCSPHIGHO2_01_FULL_40_29]OFZ34205.1 MAG: GTPase HflX [Bdellovibrionales bacterium RIFCSPHIGHO2_02_FULL_40_15]